MEERDGRLEGRIEEVSKRLNKPGAAMLPRVAQGTGSMPPEGIRSP